MRDQLFELRKGDHSTYIDNPTKFQLDQARKTRPRELILLFETEETAINITPLIEFLWQEKQISIAIRVMGPLLHIFFPAPTDSLYQDVKFLCGRIKGLGKMFFPDDYGKLRYNDELPVKWTEFLESRQIPAA